MKFQLALNLKQAQKMKLKIYKTKPDGIFLWIGSHGTVDRIVGFSFKRGFFADYCYYTKNNWIVDLWHTLFEKTGFVTLTTFSN